MTLIFRTVVGVVLLTSISFGRDIYVHGKRGDNRNTGHSVREIGLTDGPVRTISRAVELAEAGDKIVIDPKGGPYREAVSLVGRNKSGAGDLPLIIEGCGAVLDGREAVPTGVWKHYKDDIYRFQLTMQAVNTTYFALYDNEELLERVAVAPDAKSLPSLEPNTWCFHRGFVYFRTEADKSPLFESDYLLSYSARQVGVSLIQVFDVRIHDLNVQGFQLDGISAANGALRIILDNVKCEKNGRSGLAIGGGSTVFAGYCTFADNQTMQVLALPYSRSRLYDCTVAEDGIIRSDDGDLTVEEEK